MHAGTAVVLVVAVVAVAYGSAAPQLGVAEFAPAAQKALDAPPTTAGASASAAAQARRRSTTTLPVTATTSPATDQSGQSSAPTTRQPRGRACVGTPPRQIEDPLSPPCIPTIFEGDNGGATSAGVNATEIRVGVPVDPGLMAGGSLPIWQDALSGLFEYFNRHFEFYGRRLVPVLTPGAANDAVTSRTLGTQVATSGVFSAVTGVQEAFSRTPQPALPQELARAGIVTIVGGQASWWTDRTLYDPFHPYVWSLYPSSEQLQPNLAGAACAMAGTPAVWAADPALRGKTRRFGIISAGQVVVPRTDRLAADLRDCSGEDPERVEWSALSGGSDARMNGLRRLVSSGVTTVVCACEGMEFSSVLGSAAGAGLKPEWLFSSTTSWNGDADFIGSRSAQSGLIEQVQPGRRLLPLAARPWFGAFIEVNPQLVGAGANLQAPFVLGEYLFDQLLVLASGIQGAGPGLTSDSFAASLMSMQFPNPDAGRAPYWQPSVGFGPGDHSFYNDYAIGWFSDTAPLPRPSGSQQTGSWCFVDRGARFSAGTFPADLETRVMNPDVPCR